ncbi:MAG TPA: ABC transporter ATP-binding protein [Myxococcales bacterium]|nr:ABC transporter ATP-binding protein [Myxococcales bacterium]
MANDPQSKTPEPAQISGSRVEARGLGRRFGPHVALDNVSFGLEPGESFGLLGANGAGKTTFIRLLTGFLVPSSGDLTVDGLSPARDPRAVQARIGYVPETPRLYSELRVRNFLGFAAGLRGLPRARRRGAVADALERFRLESVAHRLIGHLSKGYRQRVSLAQAFLHAPSLLIVDEPTSGLDPLQSQEIREVLAGLAGEATLLLCTHDLAEARALTTRCAVLRQGALVALGESEALLGGGNPMALFHGGDPDREADTPHDPPHDPGAAGEARVS